MSFWLNIPTFCFDKIASSDSVWNDSVGNVAISAQHSKNKWWEPCFAACLIRRSIEKKITDRHIYCEEIFIFRRLQIRTPSNHHGKCANKSEVDDIGYFRVAAECQLICPASLLEKGQPYFISSILNHLTDENNFG